MTSLHRSLASLLAGLAFAAAAAPQAAAEGVYVVPIHGDIEPSTAVFVRKQATEALGKGASRIVFDIDTFGGRVDSALRISSFIGSVRDAETVAYVRSGPDSMGVSWSAGALIALSCSAVYMAPGTSIGAAAPVVASPDGKAEGAGEKTVSAVRAQMAALAEKNGYPPAIALAMADADVELWEIDDGGKAVLMTSTDAEAAASQRGARKLRLVSPAGKLLSLTALEAERFGLSSGTVAELSELAALLGAPGPIVELERSPADALVVFITSAAVQSLLILLGLVAIFLEINTPGFGIPGTVAVVAFLVLFGSNALIGTVGSVELILFIVGLGLLAVELFLLPGFGVAGISGIVAIAVALVLSMQDFIIPSLDWEWELLGRNVLTVGVGILASIAGIGVLALAGPRLRLFDAFTLKATISGTAHAEPTAYAEPSAYAGPEGEAAAHPLAGKGGVALSTLRPSGRAEIDGRVYSVESDGTFIEEGERIVACGSRAGIIIVTKERKPC